MSAAKNDKVNLPQQKFYTVKQLAERWQRDGRSISRDIKRGDLAHHKFGKSVRISEDDVLLFEAIRRKKR